MKNGNSQDIKPFKPDQIDGVELLRRWEVTPAQLFQLVSENHIPVYSYSSFQWLNPNDSNFQHEYKRSLSLALHLLPEDMQIDCHKKIFILTSRYYRT